MPIDRKLLEILVCPECLSTVRAVAEEGLECVGCGRVYPVRDGTPVMLVSEASPPTRTDAGGAGSGPRTGTA